MRPDLMPDVGVYSCIQTMFVLRETDNPSTFVRGLDGFLVFGGLSWYSPVILMAPEVSIRFCIFSWQADGFRMLCLVSNGFRLVLKRTTVFFGCLVFGQFSKGFMWLQTDSGSFRRATLEEPEGRQGSTRKNSRC